MATVILLARLVLFVGLTLFIPGALATLYINASNFENLALQTGQYYWKGDDINSRFDPVSAQLVDFSASDLSGKIVFQSFLGFRDWLGQIKHVQEQGAVAILYGTDSRQYGCALASAEPQGQVTIPIAEISQSEFTKIRTAILAGDIIEATLTSEGNPWNFLAGIPVIIVFRVIYTTAASGLVLYALYKLVTFIQFKGSQFNVSQVCLALEIIANLLRIVFFAVDPLSCFGNFGIVHSFFTTISFPFEVGTFVLITFYWYEVMTSANIRVYAFLNKSQPYFFGFTIGLILAVFIVTILGFYLAFEITTPLIIIYVVVSLGFVIFYIITLVKIIKQIKTSSNLRVSKTITVQQVNKKIILNGVARMLSLVPVITFVSPDIATVPVPHYIGSVFIYGMIMVDSWSRIYLFQEPSRKKKEIKAGAAEGISLPSPKNRKTDDNTTDVHV